MSGHQPSPEAARRRAGHALPADDGEGARRPPAILRVGVVGAGFIAQVVHLPRLLDARERFEVVGLAEPHAGVRTAVAERFGIAAAYADHDELLAAGGLDAVLVCSPNAAHADAVVDALAAGCHVLVEKPLCLTLEEADRVIAARDAAARVVQVGYMKRFDPAYEALLADLAADGDRLAFVSTVTVDPGLTGHFGPFVAPQPPAERPADPLSDAFLGALVHDVNAVHGILETLGEPFDEAVVVDGFGDRAAALAGGTAVLPSGLRLSMTWARIPRAGTFEERIELLGSRGVRRLGFAAPYLGQPTAYTLLSGQDGAGTQRTFRSWRESYVRQLEHFHACVVDGTPCRTPPEQARADIALLTAMHDATLAAA